MEAEKDGLVQMVCPFHIVFLYIFRMLSFQGVDPNKNAIHDVTMSLWFIQKSGWWFQIFFGMFIPIWGRFPF